MNKDFEAKIFNEETPLEELIGFERLCIARSSSIISARTSEESLHPHSVTFRFTIMPPRISQPHCAGGRGKHVVPKSKAAFLRGRLLF